MAGCPLMLSHCDISTGQDPPLWNKWGGSRRGWTMRRLNFLSIQTILRPYFSPSETIRRTNFTSRCLADWTFSSSPGLPKCTVLEFTPHSCWMQFGQRRYEDMADLPKGWKKEDLLLRLLTKHPGRGGDWEAFEDNLVLPFLKWVKSLWSIERAEEMIRVKWKLEEIWEINVLIRTRPFSLFSVAICLREHENTVLAPYVTAPRGQLYFADLLLFNCIADNLGRGRGSTPTAHKVCLGNCVPDTVLDFVILGTPPPFIT